MAKRHFPTPPVNWDQSWGMQLVRELQRPDTLPYTKAAWLATYTPNLTISTGVSTLAQTQDVLGTLIAQLQKKGII